MKAFLTGGSGFIGGNVARVLVERGFSVRLLLRPQSSSLALQGLDFETVIGDLTDPVSLNKGLKGCQVLFHAAAVYSLWTPDPRSVYEANVQGTRNILTAAAGAGVEKVVFTSSESTIGLPPAGGLGREDLFADLESLPGAYKRSKLLAEQIALDFARQGLPLVVVNPTTPVGVGDVKPTPTGHIVLDYLKGRMPAFVDTGLNLVDVEDVAVGHLLALQKGRVGERYILGNQNLTLKQILGTLAHLTGRKPPSLRIPFWLAMTAARFDEWLSSNVTHRPPSIPVAGVMAARKLRFMDCSKAVAELGFPQNPIIDALEKEIRWFKQNGYVR